MTVSANTFVFWQPIIIDGKGTAATIRQEIAKAVKFLKEKHKATPGLATVLVGNRTDSATYVRFKKKAAAEVGFHSIDRHLDEKVTEEELLKVVKELAEDDEVHGILVQLPLPKHINEHTVLSSIPVNKHFNTKYLHALWKRIVNACRSYASEPQCYSDETRLFAESMTREALCAFTLVSMRRRVIYKMSAQVKPGATVIDVGINSKPDATRKRGYRLVGDVDYKAVKEIAGAITPVPGGVGPMTIAMLLKNTFNLCLSNNKISFDDALQESMFSKKPFPAS
eukprot:jgi/Bigna1/76324/fgenesh1_pg.40_\